jgi:diaminopimelate decarboxylase
MPSAMMRKRQHRTVFLDKSFNELPVSERRGFLSGATTLSSDYVYPGSIPIPEQLSPGEYVLVKDVGAYAATQHMEFLNQPPPAEVLVNELQQLQVITERGPADDKVRHVLQEPVLINQYIKK